jgi:hypothetical protein
MKSPLLLAIALTISVVIVAQTGNQSLPPAAAKTAFAKAFPGAVKAKWEKEKNDYEVEFGLDGKKMSAVYDKTGLLKETEQDIKPGDLPADATSYVKMHYPKNNIKAAAKITKPNAEVNYEAELNKKDLIFDASGKFIREEKDLD